MHELLSKLALIGAIGVMLLLLCAAGSCTSSDKTQISQAEDELTYGDTMGQDADEMIELLESA